MLFAWLSSPRGAFPVILAIALLVRVPLLPPTQSHVFGEAVLVARSLSEHGQFANPFGTPTGPTAHVAPIYPGLLSLILLITPYGPEFHRATMLLALTLVALSWASLPYVATGMGLSACIGVLAGVLGAMFPFRHATELDGAWEAPLVAPALALLTGAIMSAGRLGRYRAVWLGVAVGVLILTQPVTIGPCFGLLFLQVLRHTISLRRGLLVAFVSLAVLTPWTIRNWSVLGGMVFIRSNLGLELSVSNGPLAKPLLAENLNFGQSIRTVRHPDTNRAEAQLMRATGELKYNRLRLREALDWIAGSPASFLRLTGRRMSYFVVPNRRNVIFRGIECAISILALTGVWMMLKSHLPASVAILVIWITYSPIYFLIQVDERYRYPIEWSVFLCAAFALQSLAVRFQNRISSWPLSIARSKR